MKDRRRQMTTGARGAPTPSGDVTVLYIVSTDGDTIDVVFSADVDSLLIAPSAQNPWSGIGFELALGGFAPCIEMTQAASDRVRLRFDEPPAPGDDVQFMSADGILFAGGRYLQYPQLKEVSSDEVLVGLATYNGGNLSVIFDFVGDAEAPPSSFDFVTGVDTADVNVEVFDGDAEAWTAATGVIAAGTGSSVEVEFANLIGLPNQWRIVGTPVCMTVPSLFSIPNQSGAL